MSIVRAYADKDTWINESSTGANYGASTILEVWNKYSYIYEKKELARTLVKFDLDSLKEDIINKKYPDPRTDSSVSAYIYMFNAPHGDNQASNFDIWAFPLTASWKEGRGLDNDNNSHKDTTNIFFSDDVNLWSDLNAGTGADAYLGHHDKQYDSNSASMYFTTGEEDLKLDITNWIKEYIDSTSANNGFLIRMSDYQEAQTDLEATDAGAPTSVTGVSFFTKKFYSRETNTRKRPYVQLEWPGSIKDDRGSIKFSKTGDLYFYNVVDGVYEDLDGINKFPGFVTLSADGVAIEPSNLTASRVSTGIYKINIGTAQDDNENIFGGIDISLSSSESFTDSWTVTANGLTTTNTFNFNTNLPVGNNSFFNTSNIQVNLTNLKSNYDYGSISNIRVFVKDKSTLLKTLTGSSTALNSFIVKNGQFQIREKATDSIEINDIQLSYDDKGNYFELNTINLYPQIEYKVVLKLNIRGETIVVDDPEKWNFIVK
jgi:hypothetical protein